MQISSVVTVLPFLLSVMVGVFVGLGSFTAYYAQGFSYLSNDPKACANCHVMREQYDGWQKASHHAAATCNDCHVPHDFVRKYWVKAENGFWHSKGMTLMDFHDPIQIRPKNRVVLQENCLECHAELVSQIATHPGNEAQMLDCINCHRSVGHGPAS